MPYSMRICMRIGMRHSMGHSMGHSMPHGMRNGVRSLRMPLNGMRMACAKVSWIACDVRPPAAPKTSDESPPWHAQSWHTQSWHAPRHAPRYATCHGIYVRIIPGCAWVTPPRELSPKLIIPGPVGRWR